jgi:hypothetical protein
VTETIYKLDDLDEEEEEDAAPAEIKVRFSLYISFSRARIWARI